MKYIRELIIAILIMAVWSLAYLTAVQSERLEAHQRTILKQQIREDSIIDIKNKAMLDAIQTRTQVNTLKIENNYLKAKLKR